MKQKIASLMLLIVASCATSSETIQTTSLEKGELDKIGYSYLEEPCTPEAQMERWLTEIARAEGEGRDPVLVDDCDTIPTVEQILTLNAKLDAL